MRIWQDLVESFGYGYSYESVKRYVRTLASKRRAAGVMHSLAREEAQVKDDGAGRRLGGRGFEALLREAW